MGEVVHRHGVVYAQEYGWDERFEALVAEIVADFIRNFDPERDAAGSPRWTAKLSARCFSSRSRRARQSCACCWSSHEPRGHGLGGHLIDECVRFARAAGYTKITLWTNHVLAAARSLYEKAGFRLVEEKPHNQFGEGLIGQTWELTLST